MKRPLNVPFLSLLLAVFASTMTQTAWAYDSAIKAGLGSYNLKYQDQTQSVSGSSGGFTLGYVGRFNPYIGFDARIGGAGSTTSAGLTLKPGAFFALFVRPSLPVGENVDMYGLLGFTSLAVGRTPANGSEQIIARVGGSFGLGADFRFNQNMSVGLEYVSYQHDVDFGPSNGKSNWDFVTQAKVSLSATTVNFKYQF